MTTPNFGLFLAAEEEMYQRPDHSSTRAGGLVRGAAAPPSAESRARLERAEAKRSRRRERNLRLAGKTAPSPVKITSNAQKLLMCLRDGGNSCSMGEVLAHFPTAQSARATVAAALKAGLVTASGPEVSISPLGSVSLAQSLKK